MEQIEQAISILNEKNASLVAITSTGTLISYEHGIAPLCNKLKEHNTFYFNSVIADKVIGKAAALLMVYGGVKEVHANIISSHARSVFDKFQIAYTADCTVERIVNRTKTGFCPMEQKCINIESPEEAFNVLSAL